MEEIKTEASSNFGEHVTIDGYGGNPEKLEDRELVYNCLDQLPEKLGMTKMGDPVLYRSEGNGLKDPGGWTGMVVINESHISIHTFSGRGFVTADVYTCKNGMDVDFIIKYFTDLFDLKDVEFNLIKRGTRYPDYNIE